MTDGSVISIVFVEGVEGNYVQTLCFSFVSAHKGCQHCRTCNLGPCEVLIYLSIICKPPRNIIVTLISQVLLTYCLPQPRKTNEN